MVKKCLYCSVGVSDNSVVDFCNKCGVGVFGEKMFSTIINNMENARERGDLCHTEGSQDLPPRESEKNFSI